ncbi:MAG: hypothetical protein R2748_28410 [Bryobacterales bacterium]
MKWIACRTQSNYSRKSISLDENYAMAYAGLSKAYLDMRARTLEPEWVLKADKASLRAVELRPDLLETQTARGRARGAGALRRGHRGVQYGARQSPL